MLHGDKLEGKLREPVTIIQSLPTTSSGSLSAHRVSPRNNLDRHLCNCIHLKDITSSNVHLRPLIIPVDKSTSKPALYTPPNAITLKYGSVRLGRLSHSLGHRCSRRRWWLHRVRRTFQHLVNASNNNTPATRTGALANLGFPLQTSTHSTGKLGIQAPTAHQRPHQRG